jgi:hypothetical protein
MLTKQKHRPRFPVEFSCGREVFMSEGTLIWASEQKCVAGFQDIPSDPFKTDPVKDAEKVVQEVDEGVKTAATKAEAVTDDSNPAPNLAGKLAGAKEDVKNRAK